LAIEYAIRLALLFVARLNQLLTDHDYLNYVISSSWQHEALARQQNRTAKAAQSDLGL
jgi:hypothetical protein